MTINQLFAWLLNSGGSALAVSWLIEKWAWYQSKSADAKRNLFFGFCVGLSTIAYAVLTYVPQNILDQMAPFFGIIYSTFVAVYLGTKFHLDTKA